MERLHAFIRGHVQGVYFRQTTKEVATKYGVLMANGQMANRWTFYIDKSGKVVAIDTAVRPATSAEDMIAKLAELKVAKKG